MKEFNIQKNAQNIHNAQFAQNAQNAQKYERIPTLETAVTLKDLKTLVCSTRGKRIPTDKQLRENDELVLTWNQDGSRVNVYRSGFATYRSGRRTTILRVDRITSATYEFCDSNQHVDMTDYPWEMALMITGEDRLEKNKQDYARQHFISIDDDYCNFNCDGNGFDFDNDGAERNEPSYYIVAAPDVDTEEEVLKNTDESLEHLLSCLTERQRQIAIMYYIDEYSQPDIARILGVKQQTITEVLKAACTRLKKSRGVI